MTKQDFEFIRSLAYDETGIVLPERKKHMVYSRLSRRLRRLNLNDFGQYCEYVKTQPTEMMNFVNALTTNLTAFFREEHHFDYLEQNLIPQWKQQKKRKLRIWSSACSTGEEAYSLAMTLEQHFSTECDLKILATDLDTNVLKKATDGVYTDENLESLPAHYREKYIKKAVNGITMKQSLKKLIHFKQLNLLHGWPMAGPFDVIFCRNVLIYFDNPTKAKIIKKFKQMLAHDGLLFIGHSETLTNISNDFDLIGQTIYQPKSGTRAKLSSSKKVSSL